MSLPHVILVPTDFGDPSEAALDCALEYASMLGAQIVLMHAYEMPIVGFPESAVVASAELTARILENAKEDLDRQIASRAESEVVLRGLIKQGDPADMVIEAAEEVGAELICLGTHGRRGLPRMLLGSVAERVVRASQVPVLTIHATVRAEASKPPLGKVVKPPPGVWAPSPRGR